MHSIQDDEHNDLIPETGSETVEWFTKLSIRDKRSLIFNILYIMESHDYSISMESIIDNLNKGFDLEVPLNSDVVAIARSIIDERNALDDSYKPFLTNWRYERVSICTKLILRYSMWELKHTDTPPTVIINEAIELAKCYAEKDAYKFINGILDESIKKNGIVQPADIKE